MFISCDNDWRKIRYFITALLKSWITTEIKKLNYIKSYGIIEGKISKKEEKLLRIDKVTDEKKLAAIINKTLPEAKILK